ncbi:MAG: hypothetical protein QMC80_06795 [Thermoplasmatales archaeon]|nr:hypothetical protein [Thermoplasmatales archaeon]
MRVVVRDQGLVVRAINLSLTPILWKNYLVFPRMLGICRNKFRNIYYPLTPEQRVET